MNYNQQGQPGHYSQQGYQSPPPGYHQQQQQSPQLYGQPQQGYGQAPRPAQHAPAASYSSNYTPQSSNSASPAPLPPPKPARPVAPTTMPPGGDVQLWDWFRSVDADGNGSLSAEELQKALVNGDWTQFNIETSRLMIKMFDTNNSGTIQFNEFTGLWRYIEEWQRCFKTFDADSSGTIDFEELKNALRTFGFNLSDNFVRLLITKYDRKGTGSVAFDGFVQSCVTIKTMTDSFRKYDTQGTGWISINFEDFLQLVITNS